MNIEEKCQVKMHNGEECGRDVDRDGLCIRHSDKSDKDLELFHQEVQKVIREGSIIGTYDFTGFVFPRDYELKRSHYKGTAIFSHACFQGPASFDNVHFISEVHFSHVTFSGGASFQHMTVEGNAKFDNAVFKGRVDFDFADFGKRAEFRSCTFEDVASFYDATFRNLADISSAHFYREAAFPAATFSGLAWFGGAEFNGRTDFERAEFHLESEFLSTTFSDDVSFQRCIIHSGAKLLFDGEDIDKKLIFAKEADFRRVTLTEPNQLVFRKVNLERCFFLETDVRRVQFIAVSWPFRGWAFSQRAVVGDEIVSSVPKDYVLLAQLYKRLQANYDTDYEHYIAGHFYVGEMEMLRKQRARAREYLSWLFLFVYKRVSDYGQSISKPLACLLSLLFAFPAFFLFGGMIFDGTKETNYDIVRHPQHLLLLTEDYWHAFALNVGFLSLNRASIKEHLTDVFQQNILVTAEFIIVASLVTLFLLALRRKFKRKSF